MVRILNPSRRTQRIEFCSESDKPKYDRNDNPIPNLISKWITLAVPWSLTTNQMLQAQGLNLTDQRVFAVPHRLDYFWNKISRVKLDNELYEIVNINPDPTKLPTSYDLVTIKKVTKHE